MGSPLIVAHHRCQSDGRNDASKAGIRISRILPRLSLAIRIVLQHVPLNPAMHIDLSQCPAAVAEIVHVLVEILLVKLSGPGNDSVDPSLVSNFHAHNGFAGRLHLVSRHGF
jgi:hypothetical protein